MSTADDLARARNVLDRVESRQNDIQGPPLSNDELRQLVAHQERYHPIYAALECGGSPPPLRSESPESYRCRLLEGLQNWSEKHSKVNLNRLARVDSDAFSLFEQAILDDARRVADDRTQGSFSNRGALREVRV